MFDSTINLKRMDGHYEVYQNGEFVCSADNFKEALDEIRKITGTGK